VEFCGYRLVNGIDLLSAVCDLPGIAWSGWLMPSGPGHCEETLRCGSMASLASYMTDVFRFIDLPTLQRASSFRKPHSAANTDVWYGVFMCSHFNSS